MQEPMWLESVYSDGSPLFVSDPAPRMGQTVTVRLRLYADAPVRHVFLRYAPNGGERLLLMRREEEDNGLAYYAVELSMAELRIHYHFYLVCDGMIYYYTQRGITTSLPGITYDFVLLTDYVQPRWVKSAVFYQIFPERFCNGEPGNDVTDGEYRLEGHETVAMKDWTARPMPYAQAHCVDFYGGDLQGVERKIPYLKKLGVNAVYLNPIFTAPSVHKYDCIDYFHVDPHFGGDEALASLSRALHDNGMRLILDISINHTGAAHRWFNRDCEFFPKEQGAYHNPEAAERDYYFFESDQTYLGWNGVENMPVLNYTAQTLRDVIYRGQNSVLRKWLRPPYCIDGWRFDVADVFARNGRVQLAHTLWPQIRACIRQENPQAYILAEDWGDCAQYLQGTEWDSAMNYYGFGRVMRQFLGQADLFARHPYLQAAAHPIPAQDVESRVMEHLAKLPFALWQNQFNLFDSHDTPRLHNDPAIHPGQYRGAVMMLFTFIGAASIYYGDEAAVDGWLDGSEGCRFPMPWHRDIEGGSAYALYKTMAHLKTGEEALCSGGMKFLYAKEHVLCVARFTRQEAIVTVMSTAPTAQCVRIPLGVIGAKAPLSARDVLGTPLQWQAGEDGKSILLTVEGNGAYCFRCCMK